MLVEMPPIGSTQSFLPECIQLKKLPLSQWDVIRNSFRVLNNRFFFMRSRISLLALALAASFVSPALPLSAQVKDPEPLRVLAREKGGFNVSVVVALIKKGDLAVTKGNLAGARKHFDKARDVSKQLLSFYRDIGGAFRGLDARIPREMDSKGRKTLSLLADWMVSTMITD